MKLSKDAFSEFNTQFVRVLNRVQPDVIAAHAASATLFMIISFFPFMIMLLSLLQFFPFDTNDLELFDIDFIPQAIQTLIFSMIEEIKNANSVAVLPIAAITGLWSASTGISSLTKGLNVVYNRKETRNYFIVRGMCLLYTVVFIVVLVAVLAILVFGTTLYHWLIQWAPFLETGFLTVINLRSITAAVVLTLFFTLLYITIPDRKAKWYYEIPGALLAALGWMIFSYLYSLYISNVAHFTALYGSLTAVVLLLLWLYACMYILFVGAFVNVAVQRLRHKQGK